MLASQHRPLNPRPSSTQHYQTFDTPPPKSRGRPNSGESGSSAGDSNNYDGADQSSSHSPLTRKQMAVLAMIALAEQTALNSISPYLPDMALHFPDVQPGQVGLYVGSIASAFAIAQFVTNYFWGWLSDRVGRKPINLLGTVLTAGCFLLFGLCRTLWQAIVVQALMGAVNGNRGLVSTCLGKITDKRNQSKAFTYLPILYHLGSITGPLVGGLLVFERNPFNKKETNPYPYLAPNLLSAGILMVDFVLSCIFLDESLENPYTLPQLGKKVRSSFSCFWHFTGLAKKSTYAHPQQARYQPLQHSIDESQEHDHELDSASEISEAAHHHEELSRNVIFSRDTSLLLVSFLIFQLCNVSFNSLYPIFGQAQPPMGRALTPSEIGISQGFIGVVTIVFQIFLFGKLRSKIRNRWSYRAGFFGFVLSFLLMPFVGYKDRDSKGLTETNVLLAVELCVVLLIKTIASVGGLTSALLLVTSSAPDNAVLGALNSLAQTLSAVGRAAGPFLSGGLFSLSTNVKPKGEALPFGVFAIASFLGFLLSFGVQARFLEGDDNGDDNDDDDNSKSGDETLQNS